MLVELDVFSGRPNPRWQLSEREVSELTRLTNPLAPTARPAPTPPGLGYRGFRLQGSSSAPSWAYGGFVQTPQGLLNDPDHRIERYLLASLPEEYGDIRHAVEAEIGL